MEKIANIHCQVEIASEFRYRRSVIRDDTLFVSISQSGETADTLAALRSAKDADYLSTLAICNVDESSLTRESDLVFLTHAGIEIGVASTKAFTTQLAALFLFVITIAKHNGLTDKEEEKLVKQLKSLPSRVNQVLEHKDTIELIAKDFADKHHALFLGRGSFLPVAMEGALKLKEISYIHAEGYPAAEMKHGPIALIDEKMPVVFLAPHDNTYEKVFSNIQEVKARKGVIITVTDKRSEDLEKISDYIIDVPTTHPKVFPLLASISLQLLAYHLAVLRECDIDQPRNLAKSVTVE